MILHLILKLVITFVGFSMLLQGKLVEGMLFLVSGQLMDVQMTLNRIIEPKKVEKKDDQ